jgi:hypothetical protein
MSSALSPQDRRHRGRLDAIIILTAAPRSTPADQRDRGAQRQPPTDPADLDPTP